MEMIFNSSCVNGKLTQIMVINNNQQGKMTSILKKVVKNLEGKLKIWTKVSDTVGKKLELISDLRSKCTVKRVDVQVLQPLACGKFILKAIDRTIKSGLFIDWLLLKCEAANIPFTNIHEQINIYSTSDITSLKIIINQESCLPLPYIYNDGKNPMYFFLNFDPSVNRKSEKLNSRVFYDLGKNEVLVTLDVGIRFNGGYEKRVERFKIHVSGLLESYVKEHITEIKRLIVYNHVLWGFLQNWVRDVSSNVCQKKFTTKQVAENLTLHKIERSRMKQLTDVNNVFLIASFPEFALYLRFTPSFNTNHYIFLIDNIETPITSTNFIIQYYKQFFYINDETKSNALKCLLDYSQCKKTFLDLENVREYQPNEKKLPVDKPLLKTKTVEEINASVEQANKEQSNEDSIEKLLKSGAIDKEKIRDRLLPFVKDSLKRCFEKNDIEIVNSDESNDISLMLHRFQEAVNRADKSGTFQVFLEYVFHSLQMHFTNATCQKIMECMIYKELENRYNNPNEVIEELVGDKELEKLIGNKNVEREVTVGDKDVEKEQEIEVEDEEVNAGVKRKGETAEDESSPKMPKLMPVWEFIKKEREKDLGSKYSCKLKTCSVVLSKMDCGKLNEKARKRRLSEGKCENKENNLNENSISPKPTQEKDSDEITSSQPVAEEKSVKEGRNVKSPRTIPEQPILDENTNKTGGTNFMLKFPRIFLKSKTRKTSKCESDKSDTTHESDEEPQRKSQDFWEKEKLFRECLTTKAVVVINRIEDVIGVPNIQDKTVKLSKNDKIEKKSELSSPKRSSDSERELGIKEEPKVERRSTSTQVEENEKRSLGKENDDVNEPVVLDVGDSPEEIPSLHETPSTPDDDLEIVNIIKSTKPKKDPVKKCQKCLKEFNTYKEIEEHEKQEHANDKIYSCNNCFKRFHAYHFLELHVKTKHEKSLYCLYCNTTSKNIDELEKHLESKEHEEKRLSYVEEL